VADFGEARVFEYLAGADAQFASGPFLAGLGDHRIALDGAGTVGLRVRNRGGGERVADAALAVARADDEARDGPHRVVGGPGRSTARTEGRVYRYPVAEPRTIAPMRARVIPATWTRFGRWCWMAIPRAMVATG
jgi:hypothetical protein